MSHLGQDLTELSANPYSDIVIGTSAAMQKLMHEVERVSCSDLPVLLIGPTGTGKEVVANLIHRLGSPKGSPFLDVNCSAIPETLIESQLFGHEKGAFTGATAKQEGYFSLAADGVLFLDEIAELPLWQQTKLLRVLETRKFRPVGGAVNQQFHARIIAATHVDLEQRVREKRFREDLYYRLNIIQLRIPALHERREDIPELVKHFANRRAKPITFSPGALKQFEWASWKGNIRELKNTVDRIAVMSDSERIDADVVRSYVSGHADETVSTNQLGELATKLLELDLPNKLDAVEYALIQTALKQADGNKSAAARTLGVHRKYIERRLSAFDKKLEEVYQFRDKAVSSMETSKYKKAAGQLRQAIQHMECCASSGEHEDLKLDLLLKLSACLRNIHGWNDAEVVALYDNAQDITNKLNRPEKINSIRFGKWVNQLIDLNLDTALTTCASYWREGERINNPTVIAQAAISMANTQFWLGDYEQTTANLQQFINLYTHDRRIVIDSGHDPFVYYLMFKTLVMFQLGKVNTSMDTLDSLMSYVREINHPFSLATALQTASWLNYKLGEYDISYCRADELLSISKQYEFPFFEGIAEVFLSHKMATEGNYEQAIRMLESGYKDKLNQGAGKLFNSMYGIVAADIAIINERYQEGLEVIEQAIATSITHKECCYLAEAKVMRGRLKRYLGLNESAYSDFKEAQAEAEARDSKAAELKAAHAIADYLYNNKQRNEARRILTPVVLRYMEQYSYLELREANALLKAINANSSAYN